jgi:hypothetical protein
LSFSPFFLNFRQTPDRDLTGHADRLVVGPVLPAFGTTDRGVTVVAADVIATSVDCDAASRVTRRATRRLAKASHALVRRHKDERLGGTINQTLIFFIKNFITFSLFLCLCNT